VKFSKYLPLYGWAPDIITARDPIFSPVDRSLLSEVREDVRVTKTRAISTESFAKFLIRRKLEPRLFFLPDPALGWLPFAVFAGVKISRGVEKRVILATAPFYTSMVVGLIVSFVTSLPLVLDFRDPWTERRDINYPTWFHRQIDRFLEAVCIRRARKIISVTPSLTSRISLTFQVPERKAVTIMNGYDPSDFESLRVEHRSEAFVISHIGNLHHSPASSIRALLDALADLIKDGLVERDLVRLRLVGGAPESFVLQHARQIGLSSNVEILGYVPYEESLREMKRSSLLFLVNSTRLPEVEIPQKVFNYLASGRPVLALAKPGDLVEFLRNFEGTRSVDPDSPSEIAEAVLDFYLTWKREPGKLYERPTLRKYSRIEQARRLSEILLQTLSESG